MDDAPIVYEQEFDPALHFFKDEAYTVERADDGAFVVEGPKIDKMLGYTNIESEKGFFILPEIPQLSHFTSSFPNSLPLTES